MLGGGGGGGVHVGFLWEVLVLARFKGGIPPPPPPLGYATDNIEELNWFANYLFDKTQWFFKTEYHKAQF